jgi:hypothetical protein
MVSLRGVMRGACCIDWARGCGKGRGGSEGGGEAKATAAANVGMGKRECRRIRTRCVIAVDNV